MGLAWQQGPLATRSVGQFLVADPLPERLLFAEPLRRRMRVRFGGQWVIESEDVVLLHEPDRYPVAFFPLDHVRGGVLVPETRTTRHRDLGPTAWFQRSRRGQACAAGCMAVHGPAELRDHVAGPGRLRLAIDGRLL
jgi:hypothetical protein